MTLEKDQIQFSSLFSPAEVICQTQDKDRDTVLRDLLRLLADRRGIGDVEDAYQAVVARENDLPTIVAPGMAMPHARLDAIHDLVVGVATSREGIVYDPSQPDSPVKLMVLTLVPKTAPGAYLQAISSLARICQDPSTPDVVSSLSTAEQIWAFFDKGGMALPDHVRAGDVMEPVQVKLEEHDTLKRAIDLFVRHRVNELPVVNGEGDLIGVVSTHKLLKVCLPDQILWMEDLTPILNFQPFAEILRKESKTWLSEIMTTDYATVEADQPAVQVAKEISRQRASRAYVVRGRKLLGVASLETFLGKILRE
ncbi:MAG: PTS sugar transporter subunit IIA [Phycisphaerales bacterium]